MALSGATVTVACAGRSEQTSPDRGGGGGASDLAGTGGTTFVSGGGSGGASAGNGGTTGSVAPADNGCTGGSAAPAGNGGAAGAGTGLHATLGCTETGVVVAGIAECEGDFVHRRSTAACAQSPHDDSLGAAGQPSLAPPWDCEKDADCVGYGNGYCTRPKDDLPLDVCTTSCETDADCPTDQVCGCTDGFYVSVATGLPLRLGTCTPATCVTDDDCAPLLCISSTNGTCSSYPPNNFHCQSPTDECSGVADCGTAPYGADCALEKGKYVCEVATAICGRPFLVAGAPRRSEPREGSEWRDRTLAPVAALNTLDLASRARIAEHFQNAALMEHASIAAFARFSLQLLALGAPPDLVAASAQAMADETRHAELCFELASRYAGRDYGPGPLALDGAFEAVELASVVELVFAEGCVGETAAALEATWAAEAATEPLVRAVLGQIAADEERHATLAFRFVSWALERDPRLCDRLRAQLRALATPPPAHALDAATQPLAPELAAHGVLSAEQHQAARSAALHDIVPALLASFEARRQRTPSAAPSAHAAIRA